MNKSLPESILRFGWVDGWLRKDVFCEHVQLLLCALLSTTKTLAFNGAPRGFEICASGQAKAPPLLEESFAFYFPFKLGKKLFQAVVKQ